MPQEHEPNSQNAQSLDTASYLNKQIQEGARVSVRYRNGTTLGWDWPVREVGSDFVGLLMDNGQETVIPRTRISEFIVTRKAPAQ